jgi:23S rRNA (guanine745-N1)-methyltransferase
VRGCHLPLQRDMKRLVCGRKHSFDIARSGYVNLLQPQDRRSRQPGDTAAAVAARRRLHDRGFTAPLLAGILQMLEPSGSILDAGCGEGFYAGHLHGSDAVGVDISTPAIDAAAKRYPDCLWIAANADRFIPFADASFSRVLSITGRMNAPEFARVLKTDGRLLVALSAPDDLIELRGQGRDRTARTIREFSSHFELLQTARVTTTAELDAAAVDDACHSIYRPRQNQPAIAMRLTFSLDLLLFARLRIMASKLPRETSMSLRNSPPRRAR